MKNFFLATSCLAVLTLAGCQQSQPALPDLDAEPAVTVATPVDARPTIQDAREFLQQAEADIVDLSLRAARIYWVQANFITQDTNAMVAEVGTEVAELSTRLANAAKRFNDVTLPDDMRRKIDMLKRGSNFPAPDRPGAAQDLSEIMSRMDAVYGTAKFTLPAAQMAKAEAIIGEDADGELEQFQAVRLMAEARDPDLLEAVWSGWRTLAMPYNSGHSQLIGSASVPGNMSNSYAMADDYSGMVSLINEGAQELGYADAGNLWRAGYDMDADEFATEVDRLWGQVSPLYDQLHCYVRTGLNAEYGDDVVPLDQPIRADLLGNMWAQSWGNVYELVAPEGAGEGVDTTALLEAQDYDALKMVQTADDFFVSMGFDPMPETFWERSLITKPEDRDVQCHASAWNLDDIEDIRIKMCTEVTGEDFNTVHHELGHNIYQRAYKDQPVFYKDGANDGFHEAIGDMIALSITPEYLVEIGLLDPADVPGEDADIALLMRSAMDKVAFLPFGLLVDKWRWQVFDGTLSPSEYNDGWWALRTEYQGIRPPNDRPDGAFDAGAKYHIPGNTPYMRYFLAHILQYQFHKAACDQAGFDGPLHRCSVYGNEDVGKRFNAMMEMGSSKPWPDALEAFTGTRDMDGSAILEYYAPLMTYLEEQNTGQTCGWSTPQ
ncbi:M2 family metallopeptidase [Algimonas porphyrae]|uniref:Peptidase M2 n=1 Tax=Algimonas porphyrae TaxID=1128113 RepID=A0ABQ5UX15_9PROT|nr:M2 family metallopeptidase [Algimonas porphyrae]GLQ19103.1 peptidase M2 [Algimonas porphyrae]